MAAAYLLTAVVAVTVTVAVAVAVAVAVTVTAIAVVAVAIAAVAQRASTIRKFVMLHPHLHDAAVTVSLDNSLAL